MSIFGMGGNVADVSLKKDDNKKYSVETLKLSLPSQVYQDAKNNLSRAGDFLQRGTDRAQKQSDLEQSKIKEREERRALRIAAKKLHDDADTSDDEAPPPKSSTSKKEASSSWSSWFGGNKTLKKLEVEAAKARDRQRKIEEDALVIQTRLTNEQKKLAQRVADAEAAVTHERSTKTGWTWWW